MDTFLITLILKPITHLPHTFLKHLSLLPNYYISTTQSALHPPHPSGIMECISYANIVSCIISLTHLPQLNVVYNLWAWSELICLMQFILSYLNILNWVTSYFHIRLCYKNYTPNFDLPFASVTHLSTPLLTHISSEFALHLLHPLKCLIDSLLLYIILYLSTHTPWDYIANTPTTLPYSSFQYVPYHTFVSVPSVRIQCNFFLVCH